MSIHALISIEDLRVEFATAAGPAHAVDGVTFDVRPGETFALVGESGCGKSVTALAILGLLQRPAGRVAGGAIRFDGQDLTRLPAEAMRRIRGNRIAMIFQEPMTALNPVFTVGFQIEEVLRLHQKLSRRDARDRAIALLERVGIPDPGRRIDEYPHQLSGGMRQRVTIAMAVGCRPALLIADEPTTALDVTVQAQVFELMRALTAEQGTAVLLITHDMGVVYENARRVAVMYAGRIVEEAPRDDLFARPQHPYTQLLLRSMPSRSVRGRRLATIEGMVPPATEFPPGCRFANRCPRVMDRCRASMPPDVALSAGRRAACFLLEGAPPAPLATDLPAAPASARDAASVRLEIRDLKVHFPIRRGLLQRVVGRVHAVDGVSLRLARGETLALVGESGCGKTTAGRTIVGLAPVTAGSVRVNGTELAGLSRAALKPFRRRIQVIFQDPQSSLNPRMTVGDAIVEGMEVHGIGQGAADRQARLAALLLRVGLHSDMASRYPHEFSGGQRQRIGLARALAVEPELIVCDEATSSLDVSVQAQVLNLFKDLQSELGLSYLFITHDMGVVQYLADRVAVMYLGRIVEEGETADVLGGAKHPYTVALLSAVPRIGADGAKRIVLEGDVPSPIRPPSGCPFHPRCPHAMPVCRERYPDDTAHSPTHVSRCWLHAASANG
jgi:peptide/nickel transport system ATP-binding protein